MTDEARRELEQLADAAGGMLTAEAVVDFARDRKTALHREFTWDDREAARCHRLDQARQLIRVYVTYLPQVRRTVRAFVSVPTDRTGGLGYRRVAAAISNPDWHCQMVEEVANRVRSLRSSYAHLAALDGLWPRLDRVVQDYLAEIRGEGQRSA